MRSSKRGASRTGRRATASGAANGHGFGTAPVFLASICTILGAILYLRLGYSVAHVGLLGTLAIIFIGHLVTVPTALAISEIATNRRVEGGGVYFIISRSFGTTIGGAIGVALYLSQAISVAFYLIAFAESFRFLEPQILAWTGLAFDPRMVSIPITVLLSVAVFVRGADLGIKALWLVAAVLGISIVLFLLGPRLEGATGIDSTLLSGVPDPDPFMLVFAIVFPAFTGITAGVGLSGDLANPRRSIPLGTMLATLAGMAIYVAVVVKLADTATAEQMAAEPLIMTRIALWGPIIPIGLACAAFSSALGSILVAPRTLQALGADRILPSQRLNAVVAHGVGAAREPRTATVITAVLALTTVAMGNIDFVARIISMFFMLTYGALCAISALEHFAARPDYRPTFRSKWYVSLIGALACLFLMVQMDLLFAILAILAMLLLYRVIRTGRRDQKDDLGVIFLGAMTQLTRYLQVRLQKRIALDVDTEWRPSVIMVDGRTFDRAAPIQLLTWLCHRYAVGTYLHFIPGVLEPSTFRQSREVLDDLIELNHDRKSSLFVDTMISPSMRSALAQSLQVPGVSGMDNNTALFEFSIHDPEEVLEEIEDGCRLAWITRMDTLVLRHSDQFFGTRRRIHLWLTWNDYRNANLMILLAYMLLGHDDWDDAEIQVFAAFPASEIEENTTKLRSMAEEGRIPVSPRNLEIIPTDDRVNFAQLVENRSSRADLVVLGFTEKKLEDRGADLFRKHPTLRDVLYVSARQRIDIE